MATDDYLAYLQNKKLIAYDVLKEHIFDYLRNLSVNVLESTYRKDGVYDSQVAVTGSAIGEVSVPAAFESTDGVGKKFEFSASDSRLQDVPFENSNGITYHIGLKSIDLEDELEINPRTGQSQYRRYKETIGEKAEPNTVVDNGTNLTITVDSVTESGVSHAGRTVRAFLKTPLASTWVDAYEDVAVTWDGSNNKITTTGLLGQSVGSVSTTVSDYWVVELGPKLVRQTTLDLRTATGVCFLASFVGNTGSSPTPDMTDQNILTGSLSDLSDITRYCPHTELKVSVRADASDTDEDQVRVETSGGTRIWGVDEDGDHWLPNSSIGMPLDDSGTFGSAGSKSNSGSFLGAINEHKSILSATMGPQVLQGIDVTGTSGNQLDYSAGYGWLPKTTFMEGGARYIAAGTVTVSSPADGDAWIYWDPTTGSISSTDTKATAYASGRLPLWKVTLASSVITTTYDITFRSARIGRHGVVTVGDGGVDDLDTNFKNLQAAVDWVAEFMGQSQVDWPGIEIWIVGEASVGAGSTDALDIPAGCEGITIKGVGLRGGQRSIIHNESTSAYSIVRLKADNVTFENILFEYRRTDSVAGSAIIEQWDEVTGLRVLGCEFKAPYENVYFAFTRNTTESTEWKDVIVRDSYIHIPVTVAGNNALLNNVASGWVFENCTIKGDSYNTKLVYGTGNQAEQIVFRSCKFELIIQSGTNLYKPNFVSCTGTVTILNGGNIVNCYFTGTQVTPVDSYETVILGGYLSGTDPIKKTSGTSKLKIIGTKINAESGSVYMVGGAGEAWIRIISCDFTSDVDFSTVAFTFAGQCMLLYSNIPTIADATANADEMIRWRGNNGRITGNSISATGWSRAIRLSGVNNFVTDNFITIPSSHSTNSGIAIHIRSETPTYQADYNIVANNSINSVGNTTYGGIGIYLVDAERNTITGNNISDVNGPGIWMDVNSHFNNVSNNHIYDVGSTVTNPMVGMVADYGIMVYGGDDNILTGNYIQLVTGAGVGGLGDGIELATGSIYNILQLNNCRNSTNGIDDNGTNNLVGASLSNNNID